MSSVTRFRRVQDGIVRLIFLLEGPVWTAAVVALALGYPDGHPLLRGILWPACLVAMVGGWGMTKSAVHEWEPLENVLAASAADQKETK